MFTKNTKSQMRKILFLLLLLLSSSYIPAYSQAAVTAPILEGLVASSNGTMAAMSGTMTSMERARQIADQALEKADRVRDLESTRKLVRMIQTVMCTSQDINLLLRETNYNSCFVSFSTQVPMIQLQMAADLASKALTQGDKINTAERSQMLKESMAMFVTGHEGLLSLGYLLQKEQAYKQEQQTKKDEAKALRSIKRTYRF
jgi:hypothetical protein